MANIFTNEFGVFIADIIEESIAGNNMFFTFAAKSTPYENDSVVPEPGTSYGAQTYEIYDELLFAKMNTSNDIARVVRNYEWETDTVYDIYSEDLENFKGRKYFVTSQEGQIRSVFVCLDNNGGAVSQNKPLRSQLEPEDTLYKMSDGYVWKFMFSISVNDYAKFGSSRYVPITQDQAVIDSAVAGAIDSITVENPGVDYKSSSNGVFKSIAVGGNAKKHYISGDNLSANSDFYNGSAIYITNNVGQGQLKEIVQYGEENGNYFVVLNEAFATQPTTTSTFDISPNVVIDGDGEGFAARAVVGANTTSIDRVEIISRGSGYTYATATVAANSGVLDINGNSLFDTEAVLNVNIPPVNGIGYNAKHDLSANKIVFSTDFIGGELPLTTFRKTGILVDPILDNISIRLANTANFTSNLAVQTSDGITGTVVDANLNEDIIVLSGLNGPIKANTYISAVDGNVAANSLILTVETDYTLIDNRTTLTLSSGTSFQAGEKVTQSNTSVYGYVDESANNVLYLTEVHGSFAINNTIEGEDSGSVATITNVGDQILRDNTGKVIYVENVLPVTRTANTTERLKMVIEF